MAAELLEDVEKIGRCGTFDLRTGAIDLRAGAIDLRAGATLMRGGFNDAIPADSERVNCF